MPETLTPDTFMAAQKVRAPRVTGSAGALTPDSFMQSVTAPPKPSESVPTPEEAEQITTQNATSFLNPTREVGMSSATPQTFWGDVKRRTLSPISTVFGGMTGDVQAHDTPMSRAMGRAQEPPEVSAQRNDLVDFENVLEPSTGPGVVRGTAEFASGLTHPTSLLMLGGILGKGLLARLASAGFSADMFKNAYEQVPALREAWDKEDYPQVRQQLTRIVLGGGMAALAARHAINGQGGASRPAAPPEQQYTITGQPIGGQVQVPTAKPKGPTPVRSSRAERRASVAPPETGVPEGVQRGIDARDRLAMRLTGKKFGELGNSERIAIDELVAQGHGFATDTPDEFMSQEAAKPKLSTQEKSNVTQPATQPGAPQAQPQSSTATPGVTDSGAQRSVEPGPPTGQGGAGRVAARPKGGQPNDAAPQAQPVAELGPQNTKLATVAPLHEQLRAAIEAATEDDSGMEWIGVRNQRGAETKTKPGDDLRTSHEWIDNEKTKNKLPGTAAFHLDPNVPIDKVVDSLIKNGYAGENSRLVLIGSNYGIEGADMPERFAAAFPKAKLISVLGRIKNKSLVPEEAPIKNSKSGRKKLASGQPPPGEEVIQEQPPGKPVEAAPPNEPTVETHIERLESAPGNFVHARKLHEVIGQTPESADAAIIEAAERGAAVLTDYDGPTDKAGNPVDRSTGAPLPREDYIKDAAGRNYVGAARPRAAESSPLTAPTERATIPSGERSASQHTTPTERAGEVAAVPQPRRPAHPVASGSETKIRVPGTGRSFAAQYSVRELDDVHASHNPYNFQKNPNYQLVNDRNYSDKTNSARIVKQVNEFDPAYLVTESPDANNGAPIIDSDGNVLGGNSRTMTLQRVYNDKPTAAKAYKNALVDKAEQLGIDPAEIARMKRPILVREIKDTEWEGASKQRGISDFNKTGTAALSGSERATSEARALTPELIDYISGQIDATGPTATLADAMTGARGTQLVNKLLDEGVFPESERPLLIDDRTKAVTAFAKDRVSKALLGQLFHDTEQMTRTAPELKNKLERLISPLSRLQGKPEWNLIPDIRDAIDVIEYAKAHDIKNLRDMTAQEDLFGSGPKFSDKAIVLAEALRDNTPTKLSTMFKDYARQSEGSLFETTTPEKSFRDVFGKSSNAERGSAHLNMMGLGIPGLIEHDVAPILRKVAIGITRTADDILKVLAPTLRGGERVERGKLVLRKNLGEQARRTAIARDSLREAEKFFDRQPVAENYEFWDRIEQGQKQKSPYLEAVAKVLRELLDGRRDDVQALGNGKLSKFYENYMPRAWKDPKTATAWLKDFFSRRPFEGGKSFLKQRTYPTMAEGRAKGLEPVTDNPVTMALMKVQEMDRYIAAHRSLNDWKSTRDAIFIDSRDTARTQNMRRGGWKPVADPIGAVYGQSVQQIAEHPNEGLWTGLTKVADALGISHKRGFKPDVIKGRDALGLAFRAGSRVETLHGTAEGTLAHEIGHQLDWKYGLGKRLMWDYGDAADSAAIKQAGQVLRDKASTPSARKAARATLNQFKAAIQKRRTMRAELKAIADQGIAHGRPKGWSNSREEKMARLAEFWTDARPMFKRIAPTVYGEFEKFLGSHPELKALKDIEASDVKTSISQPYDVGGLVLKGNWWVPEGLGQLLENHLAPGLAEKPWARGFMAVNNQLNLYNLGLSAFHVGKVSFEATITKGALGWEALLRGQPLRAARNLAAAPFAPFTRAIEGNKLLREYYKPGSQGAEIAKLVDAATAAGGRPRMDEMYRTRTTKALIDAWRKGNPLGAGLRIPSAAMEQMTNLIMDQVVPRVKMGVFADMARQHLEMMGKDPKPHDVAIRMANDWNSVDNRIGAVVRDNLFWNRYARDLTMMVMRADQWTLGTVREVGGAVGDLVAQPVRALQGKPVNLNRLAYVASMLSIHMAYSALYQYLHTGKGPEETEDYFFPKNGATDETGHPQRAALPSYIPDIYGFARHPVQTAQNKAAAGIALASQLIHNHDFKNVEIRHPDDPTAEQAKAVGKYTAEQFIPFSVRNYLREKDLGQPTSSAAEQFVGVRPAPADLDKSPAERLAVELAREHMPLGSRTKEQAARHDEENKIRRLARASNAGDEVRKAIAEGLITPAEARKTVKEAKLDSLSRAFRPMPMDQALQVWKAATPEERKKLRPLLLHKIRAFADKPPAERALLKPKIAEALASK